MDNNQLQHIFDSEYESLVSRKRLRISALFHPYRSLRCNIESSRKNVLFRVSEYYQTAENEEVRALARVLLARALNIKTDPADRSKLNHFAETIHQHIPTNNMNYQAEGEYFDLRRLFSEINQSFFNAELSIGQIGWSKRKSYRRLGYYDHRRNLIVISRIFDSDIVPVEIVKYLVFHEMLHIKIPAKKGSIHPPEFKKIERKFPKYDLIQKWLTKNMMQLNSNF